MKKTVDFLRGEVVFFVLRIYSGRDVQTAFYVLKSFEKRAPSWLSQLRVQLSISADVMISGL